jgi:hypothetical protein
MRISGGKIFSLWEEKNYRQCQESLKIKNPGAKLRPARRADNLVAIYWPFV